MSAYLHVCMSACMRKAEDRVTPPTGLPPPARAREDVAHLRVGEPLACDPPLLRRELGSSPRFARPTHGTFISSGMLGRGKGDI